MTTEYLRHGYDRIRVLGSGASAQVVLYRASDYLGLEPGTYFAVKGFLSQGVCDLEQSVLGLLLRNPNAREFTVSLYGTTSIDGRPGLALEALVKEAGWIPFEEATRDTLSISEALSAVRGIPRAFAVFHEVGVAIGDVQSSAFFVTADGKRLKTIDFSQAEKAPKTKPSTMISDVEAASFILKGTLRILADRILRVTTSLRLPDNLIDGASDLAEMVRDLKLYDPQQGTPDATRAWSDHIGNACDAVDRVIEKFLSNCDQAANSEEIDEKTLTALMCRFLPRENVVAKAVSALAEPFGKPDEAKSAAAYRRAASFLTCLEVPLDQSFARQIIELFGRGELNTLVAELKQHASAKPGFWLLQLWARVIAPCLGQTLELIQGDRQKASFPTLIEIQAQIDRVRSDPRTTDVYLGFLGNLGSESLQAALLLLQPFRWWSTSIEINRFNQVLDRMVPDIPIARLTEGLFALDNERSSEAIVHALERVKLARSLVFQTIRDLEDKKSSALLGLGNLYAILRIQKSRWEDISLEGIAVLVAQQNYQDAVRMMKELFHEQDEFRWTDEVDLMKKYAHSAATRFDLAKVASSLGLAEQLLTTTATPRHGEPSSTVVPVSSADTTALADSTTSGAIESGYLTPSVTPSGGYRQQDPEVSTDIPDRDNSDRLKDNSPAWGTAEPPYEPMGSASDSTHASRELLGGEDVENTMIEVSNDLQSSTEREQESDLPEEVPEPTGLTLFGLRFFHRKRRL